MFQKNGNNDFAFVRKVIMFFSPVNTIKSESLESTKNGEEPFLFTSDVMELNLENHFQ
jgi:hypothetical protein